MNLDVIIMSLNFLLYQMKTSDEMQNVIIIDQ